MISLDYHGATGNTVDSIDAHIKLYLPLSSHNVHELDARHLTHACHSLLEVLVEIKFEFWELDLHVSFSW